MHAIAISLSYSNRWFFIFSHRWCGAVLLTCMHPPRCGQAAAHQPAMAPAATPVGSTTFTSSPLAPAAVVSGLRAMLPPHMESSRPELAMQHLQACLHACHLRAQKPCKTLSQRSML